MKGDVDILETVVYSKRSRAVEELRAHNLLQVM